MYSVILAVTYAIAFCDFLEKEAPVLLYYCKVFSTKIWWISLVGLPHILFMILNCLKLCLQYVVLLFNLVNVLKFSPIPLPPPTKKEKVCFLYTNFLVCSKLEWAPYHWQRPKQIRSPHITSWITRRFDNSGPRVFLNIWWMKICSLYKEDIHTHTHMKYLHTMPIYKVPY